MAAPARARPHADAWILAAIVLVGLALRLYGLGGFAIEQDELYTLRDARDLGAGAVANGTGPGIAARPLYYLLQHGLLGIFPASPLVLRLPAFVFGVAGIWATWLLGRRLFGREAGAVAAALCALSPWHLYTSQFARYWTLVFLLAALFAYFLLAADEEDRPRLYLGALVAAVLGALTHPTFMFPLPGIALGLTLVGRDGRPGWHWPSRRAWIYFWIPLVAFVVGHWLLLKLTGSKGGSNWGPRGLRETVLMVGGLVQWMTAGVATAAVLSAAWLVARPTPERRRAAALLLGGVGAVALLVAASFVTSVYADYGMSMLPLVFALVGGGVARLAAEAPRARVALPVASTLVLSAAAAPELASHLVDGGRFDYRATYAYIEAHGPERLLVTWPLAVSNYYAPNARRYIALTEDTRRLDRALAQERGFWLVTSTQRQGLAEGLDSVLPWVDRNCRRVMRTEPMRLDFRTHRVELSWCGEGPVPGS